MTTAMYLKPAVMGAVAALIAIPAAQASEVVNIKLDSSNTIADVGPDASISHSDTLRDAFASIDDASGSLHSFSASHPVYGVAGTVGIEAHAEEHAHLHYVGPDATLTFSAVLEGTYSDNGSNGLVRVEAGLSALDIPDADPSDHYSFASPAGGAASGGLNDLIAISFDVSSGMDFRVNATLFTTAGFICSAPDNCGLGEMDFGNTMSVFLAGLPDGGTLTSTDQDAFTFQIEGTGDDGGGGDVPEPAGLGLFGLGLLGLAIRRRRRA